MSKRQLVKTEPAQSSSPVHPLDRIQHVLDLLMEIVVCVYMMVVLVLLPLYHENGYVMIATVKENMFMAYVRYFLPAAALYLALGLLLLLLHRDRGIRMRELLASLSPVDILAALYGAAAVISYLLSPYREDALWGVSSWRMGLLPQLTFVAGYFLISRVWNRREWAAALLLPVSGLVFLLGYLNRFGYYPYPMEGANPEFISLIGNINWYCGYLVTVLFGGVYLLWSGGTGRRARILLWLYAAAGFASLVTQGSDGGILTLGAVMFVLLLLSLKDAGRLQRYFAILFLLGIVCLVTFGVRLLFPEAMTYRSGTSDLLTATPLAAVFPACCGLAGLWVYRRRKRGACPTAAFAKAGKWLLGAAGVCAGGFVLLLTANTLWGLGPLEGSPLFTFSPEWGSMRGATWTVGWMCFARQGFLRRFVGVGPDCMAPFIAGMQDGQVYALVQEWFGGLRLTNAHNEWLTLLVDTGILGAVSFAGLMLAAMTGFLRAGERPEGGKWAALAGACGLCVLAYTVHNMFSFQQIMNTPTLFVILGMGEAFRRAGADPES